jgi:AcrR family transcriptional regulator
MRTRVVHCFLGGVIYISHIFIVQMASIKATADGAMGVETISKKRNVETSKPTQQRLVEAAEKEFREFGYSGTNSNQIASRAGFAPQTFYRHFSDKLEVFFAVYETWTQKELALLEQSFDVGKIADTIIAHHRLYRVFRRDLRRLTVENEAVAAVRAASRTRHLEKFSEINPAADPISRPQRIATLLIIERLADAIADREFALLGVSESDARSVLINTLVTLLK